MQAPKVELPKGGGAIQGIGETFKANPATGTASFSVPLSLSPSRGGVQPAIALSYDSGAGNGPFGLGWNAGIASISRKTNKGLPTYRDTSEGSEDTYVLTGAEDLVPALIEGPSSWDLDTYRDEDDTYDIVRFRPRTEGGFTRIERWTKVNDPTDVHWRTHSADNTRRVFGESASARVADPDDDTRIFSWLLERVEDEVGNQVLYEYESGNLTPPNTPAEVGRSSTYTYPKTISYGNREVDWVSPDFMFKVVFDYGGHDVAAPDIADDGDWTVRPDPFSTFRAGFDRRCYGLCKRVLVYHNFPAETDTLPQDPALTNSAWVLVRSTELTYDASPQLTCLTGVIHHSWGYDTGSNTWTSAPLPGLIFEYTEPVVEANVQPVEGLEGLPAGFDPRGMQWVDLDGEGLTGMLTEAAGAWFYRRNEGQGRFAPLQKLRARPAIGLAGHQLLDVDRDGRLELVRTDPPAGYHERQDDGWGPFKTFGALPNINCSDPALRSLDLTGDGLPDVLIAGDRVLRWYESKGKDGYAPARRSYPGHDERKGPVLVFGNTQESIFLADMSGDGLTDLVRIRNGSVCYWPNLGYGRFGHQIQMAYAPRFARRDQFDPKRIKLADVDGSGPTDLVYVGGDGVRFWLNQAGNAFAAAQVVPAFPRVSDATTVSVTDLLGDGTACLVWSSPLLSHAWQPLRYVRLMSQGKPHLLARVINNRGRETRLSYASSTQFYLADRRAGTPWATKLPFPVQVLERVEQVDHITGWKFVQTHAYHHGFYDGVEREFRGFGMVESWDTESFSDFEDPDYENSDMETHVPPVRTRTWFHTGAWFEGATLTAAYEAEYWAGDDDLDQTVMVDPPKLPAGLPPSEWRCATRAMRGRALRIETFADDDIDDGVHDAGAPYTVNESTFEVRQLQPAQDGKHAVYLVVPGPSRAAHYERLATPDPRVAMTVPLVIDDYGNVTCSAVVSFGRRGVGHDDDQLDAQIVVTESGLIHQVPSVVEDPYHLAVPYKTQTWELLEHGLELDDTQLVSAAAINTAFTNEDIFTLDFEQSVPVNPAYIYIRELSLIEIDYYNDSVNGALANGTLGERALVYQKYQKVLTSGMLADSNLFDGDLHTGAGADDSLDLLLAGYVERVPASADWWIASGVQSLEAGNFYQSSTTTDPWGNETTVAWDDAGLLITEVTDAVGNSSEVVIDYRVLAPNKLIGI
ncbi:MAG: toxin, partial [Actinomycetia bacterium]|nr:toxin [Actinomycetes bacterium]